MSAGRSWAPRVIPKKEVCGRDPIVRALLKNGTLEFRSEKPDVEDWLAQLDQRFPEVEAQVPIYENAEENDNLHAYFDVGRARRVFMFALKADPFVVGFPPDELIKSVCGIERVIDTTDDSCKNLYFSGLTMSDSNLEKLWATFVTFEPAIPSVSLWGRCDYHLHYVSKWDMCSTSCCD